MARGKSTHQIDLERERRLCLRPKRVPGKVPECEDDKELGDKTQFKFRASPITLPHVKWLERFNNEP